MELTLTVPEDKTAEKFEVSDQIFGVEFNEPLVHQVVTAYLAGSRAGTVKQKTKGEVSGGGKKPWKQKGSGRARAGSIRSPLWRTGGKTFAAVPQDFSQKVNKKMYRGAIRSILSELVRQDRLKIVESFTVEEPKTKLMISKLTEMGLEKVLIVLDDVEANVYLSANNIPYVEVIDVAEINPVSLIKYEHVLMTKAVIEQLEEWLA